MDAAALREKLEAARSYIEEIEGISFRLMDVTEWEMRVIDAEADGRAWTSRFRSTAERAIRGFSGLKVSHVFPDAPADALVEPIEYSAEAVKLLLDYRVDIADKIAKIAIDRFLARRKTKETETKN